VLCAGSTLLLAEDESTSIINGVLVGVLLSQSASPSVVFSFLLLIDKPWFLTKGKACRCAHHTFHLEFPNCLAIIIINYTPAIKPFSGTIAGEEKEDLCKGSFSHAHPLLCFIVFHYFIYFYLHCFISKTQKN
jgi:hypothetical protein